MIFRNLWESYGTTENFEILFSSSSVIGLIKNTSSFITRLNVVKETDDPKKEVCIPNSRIVFLSDIGFSSKFESKSQMHVDTLDFFLFNNSVLVTMGLFPIS